MTDYPIIYTYGRALLLNEIIARAEEGADPPALDLLRSAVEAEPEERLPPEHFAALYAQIEAVPRRTGWPFHEPSDLASIRRARPSGSPYSRRASDEDLEDRVLGAWLGRAGGCLLGKPVEGWPRERIASYLRQVGAFPLQDYLPFPPPDAAIPDWPAPVRSWFRGHIGGMPRDDDMDYPILNLTVLERHGLAFSPDDIAQTWLTHLPYEGIYTAERLAYRNLVNELGPPGSASRYNPYREWIGAQIRADVWGYVCPGNPEQAAELAWRDACVSHTGNGTYGEMFVAALIAAALTANSVDEALDAAIHQIPARSRFAEMVSHVRAWARELEPEVCFDRIERAYGRYHWVHTINNAAVVVAALILSGGDYSQGITVAVAAGWDTDCNGATAGSVLGAVTGAEGIPERWTQPLHDRVQSFVIGEGENHISHLAARTRAVTRHAEAG